jgi:hypothetical protein
MHSWETLWNRAGIDLQFLNQCGNRECGDSPGLAKGERENRPGLGSRA